jgi:hypothetical protein
MKTTYTSALAALVLAGSVIMLCPARPASAQTAEPGSMPEMQAPAKAGAAKPLLSPAAMAEVNLDGKKIVIHYNSPRMRGRKIMGGLVPYGKVWRTGANPATSFVTEGDLKIGDLTVPAGKYTLYTMPAAPGTPWMLIVNKQTGQWGTVYKQDEDLGRTAMHSAELPAAQEDMSLSFEHTMKDSTQLHMKWERTDEWVKIEAVK